MMLFLYPRSFSGGKFSFSRGAIYVHDVQSSSMTNPSTMDWKLPEFRSPPRRTHQPFLVAFGGIVIIQPSANKRCVPNRTRDDNVEHRHSGHRNPL